MLHLASLVGLSSAAHAFTACQVTDIGGVDDKGFNATAWKGVQDAVAKHGIDSKLLESKSETDYMPHLSSFVAEGCDVIVSVGFLMGEATATAAKENANAKFSIVDFAYNPKFQTWLVKYLQQIKQHSWLVTRRQGCQKLV